ncbi:MAG: anthranilate synthase component I family protein [Synergistetes bacterium]|nr:anthranilate synthase component I family protein [Synergistota bacterium]MCX8128006.1 anthranilate synthase component I family protein [Synergistota bacterium]MDW8192799.1 anthranilate synthase component I family protein [Synergistota bacterium]
MEKREDLVTLYTTLPLYSEILKQEFIKDFFSDTSHSFIMSIDKSYRGGKRYTYISKNPQKLFKLFKKNGKFYYEVNGITYEDKGNDFEKVLEEETRKQTNFKDFPPFYGGLFGYISYEIIEKWEEIYHMEPNKRFKTSSIPIAYLGLFNNIIAIDHEEKKLYLIKNLEKEKSENGLLELLKEASLLIEKQSKTEQASEKSKYLYIKGLSSNISKEGFLKMVEKAKDHIIAGDIFQIVLSQKFSFESNIDPLDLFFALQEENPSPYMFLINFPEIKIIGSSPEILVEIKDKKVITRPLAGTRKRGKNAEEDKRIEKELLEDQKERAEHVMLVDLARNDLGRVCKPGSVKTSDLMKIEYYPHVMHIASQVEGDLIESKNPIDVLKATFPAGTVTGAPKIRAMELINDIEKEARGPYAGAVGYISFSGDMEMCITIRSLYLYNGRFHVQAGAGIVADSNPESEYKETLYKAMGPLKALKRALEKNRIKETIKN